MTSREIYKQYTSPKQNYIDHINSGTFKNEDVYHFEKSLCVVKNSYF